MNIFERILKWGEERKITTQEFDHKNETSFIVEELLESTGKYDSISAREKANKITGEILENGTGTKEEVVDAFADIIVYATGAIAKNGYDPKKVINEVLKEIESRTGKIIDGKFVKDTDVKMYKADFSKCFMEK